MKTKAIKFSDLEKVAFELTIHDMDPALAEQLFAQAKEEEANRKMASLKLCENANFGLNIRIFPYHTEYYMDTNRPFGEVRVETYSGVDDLRDKDHFA